jgi:hypothetical protein
MRIRRAQELDDQLALRFDVVGELALAAKQRVVLEAANRVAAAEARGDRIVGHGRSWTCTPGVAAPAGF